LYEPGDNDRFTGSPENPMPILFLLFVIVPIVEIAVLLKIGSAIGWFTTLVIVVGTAALGTWMLRQQGMKTLATARSRMDAGQLPATELLEGVVLLFGGALLLTPGFLSDTIGFLCLIPATRRWMVAQLGARAALRAGSVTFGGGAAGPAGGTGTDGAIGDGVRAPGGPAGSRASRRPGQDGATGAQRGGHVIDGEYERID